jgi:hypothetical protein
MVEADKPSNLVPVSVTVRTSKKQKPNIHATLPKILSREIHVVEADVAGSL